MPTLPPLPPQAILDLDGSRSISQQEFLSAAKDYIELERMATSAASAEVRDTLVAAARAFASAKDDAADVFSRLDGDGDGRLVASEVVELLHALVPGLSNRQVQYLLTWIHNADLDKRGSYALNELLVALHAVPVVYPGGRIDLATFEARVTAPGGEAGVAMARQVLAPASAQQLADSADLAEMRLGRPAKVYLVDQASVGGVGRNVCEQVGSREVRTGDAGV